jgi:hypothetical protein
VGLSLLAPATASQVARLGSVSLSERSTGPTAKGKYAQWLAYSRCMRSHGVADFPDPTQVDGGIQISGSAPGIDPQSSLFMSAQRSCRHLSPGGGEPPTHAHQQQALARLLHVSRCMRAHGISGFPDPTLSPPSSRAGYSRISSNGIAWLAIPDSIDVRASVFEQAARACDF